MWTPATMATKEWHANEDLELRGGSARPHRPRRHDDRGRRLRVERQPHQPHPCAARHGREKPHDRLQQHGGRRQRPRAAAGEQTGHEGHRLLRG